MSHPTRYRTGDHALIRQINLSAILFHLRESAPISRAALAEITGLNKTTVSSLVGELIEKQFVCEVGLESGGVGRRAIKLRLNPAAGCVVSGEIGVDFVSVVAADFAAEIIWRRQTRIDPAMGQDAILERTVALLQEAVAEGTSSCPNLLAVGVGVPGLVDQSTGTLLFAPNLGWKDVPVRATLQAAFDAPVFVDNEANLAALGEHYFGAARGLAEVLYLSAGVGLGGGVVHDGQACRGATGVAGELGHMTMDPDGELCNCGNRGCWETQVSQQALFRHVRQAIETGHASRLSSLVDGDYGRLTVPLIADAARGGDPVARAACDAVGHSLGIGIASLVNALNPELVVFGGILSLAWEFLLPAVTDEMSKRALRWNREATQVVLARHGSDACIMGGVALGLLKIMNKRRMEEEARRLMDRLRIDIASVRLKVENLSGGQRQAVAIGRSTAFNAKVIIMDEPTAALSVAAISKVLDLIRELKRQGSSIIIISHRLEDIFEAADRVVILRHGRKVGDLAVVGTSLGEMREKVVARIIGAADDFVAEDSTSSPHEPQDRR